MRRWSMLVVTVVTAAGCSLLADGAGLPPAPTGEAAVGDPVGGILLQSLPDGEFAVTGLAWAGVIDGEDATVEWAVSNTDGGLFSGECPDGCLDDAQPFILGWASSDGIYAFSDGDAMYGFDPVEEEVVWEKPTTGSYLAPAPDLRHVLVIDSAGEVEAWSARTGRVEARFQIDLPDGFDIDAFERSDHSNRILLVDGGGTYVLASLGMESADILGSGEIDAINEDALDDIRLSGPLMSVDGEPYDPATGEIVELPDSPLVEESLDNGRLLSVTGEMAVVKLFRDDPEAADVRMLDRASGESIGVVASDGSNLITSFPSGDDLTSLLGITEDQRLVAMSRTDTGFRTEWEADLPQTADPGSIGIIAIGENQIAMLADDPDGESMPVIFPIGG